MTNYQIVTLTNKYGHQKEYLTEDLYNYIQNLKTRTIPIEKLEDNTRIFFSQSSDVRRERVDMVLDKGIKRCIKIEKANYFVINLAERVDSNVFVSDGVKIVDSYLFDELLHTKVYSTNNFRKDDMSSIVQLCQILNTKQSTQVLVDSEVNSLINSGLVINEDNYKLLLGYCTSKDHANVAIGIQMMVNCDLKNSVEFVCYILNSIYNVEDVLRRNDKNDVIKSFFNHNYPSVRIVNYKNSRDSDTFVKVFCKNEFLKSIFLNEKHTLLKDLINKNSSVIDSIGTSLLTIEELDLNVKLL